MICKNWGDNMSSLGMSGQEDYSMRKCVIGLQQRAWSLESRVSEGSATSVVPVETSGNNASRIELGRDGHEPVNFEEM